MAEAPVEIRTLASRAHMRSFFMPERGDNMTFSVLSEKQKTLFKWCHGDDNPYNSIICDGAVRSGKTSAMTVSFVLWAMLHFDNADFAICGKTVRSAERNIIMPLQSSDDLKAYYDLGYTRSSNVLTVTGQGRTNRFYVFGGRDESSYTLIQGITLSGVLLDEVALMPRSFVEQAIARTLSVSGSKLWFNCNPEGPQHWFYTEWIQKAEETKALHLHFLMTDNPIMSQEKLEEAERMFKGVFYDRYVKGLWVQAEGLIYPDQAHGVSIVPTVERKYQTYCVSIDYGTLNPCSMGLWGYCEDEKCWFRVREYYYSGRDSGRQQTDEEYYNAYAKLTEGLKIKTAVVDPSAASFIATLRRHGKTVTPADNAVVDGIRETARALSDGRIKINDCCTATIKEFAAYRWDEKCAEDRPIKEFDHAMDDMRYFVYTVLAKPNVKIKAKPKGL